MRNRQSREVNRGSKEKKRRRSSYEPNMEEYEKELNDLEAKSDKFFKPSDGKNKIRVLPAFNDNGLFYHKTQLHYKVGPQKVLVTCLGGDCPICEEVERLYESPRAKDQKRAKDMDVSSGVLFNVIDLSKKSYRIQIWSGTELRLKEILSYIADPEWGFILDPEEGYDIILTKSAGNKYDLRTAKNPTSIPDMELLEDMHDLSKVNNKLTFAQAKSALKGEVSDDDEIDDEWGDKEDDYFEDDETIEEEPVRETSKKRRRRRL